MGYTWDNMSKHTNQERLWIAAYLHRRIKSLAHRKKQSMLEVANNVLRRGFASKDEDRRKRPQP